MQNPKRMLLVLIVVMAGFSTPVFAQPDDGDPVDVPVNGPGLVLLAAAGASYVLKKIRKGKSDKNVDEPAGDA